ncbi:MAPEG family protein [Neptunicella sp. SCSIO 80796]|uniref:MAPEG family protein n=1 Tax=Neptunicella plasticusilytica TaxID=3117012 RepID=UPI003A4E3E5C
MIITPLYAGILALLFLVLSVRVILMRGKGISLGDGGDKILLRRIRAHGNFAEYVPFILLMMGILELGRFPGYILHIIGIALVVGRVLHGYSLAFTEHFKFGRMWGAAITFLLLLVCGALCLYQGINAHVVLN